MIEHKQHIIDIADYIFENPEKKVKDIISFFCLKFHKSDRTIKTYMSKAKEYNKERLQEQEKIKNKVLTQETEKNAKSGIINRNEGLKILSTIAKDKKKRDSERIKAIEVLSKLEKWDELRDNEAKNTITIEIVSSDLSKYDYP